VLVLTRKVQQQLMIGDQIRITVVRIKGNTVRLGIEAPRAMRVVRAELSPGDEQAKPVPDAEPASQREGWKAIPESGGHALKPPAKDHLTAGICCYVPAIG